MVLKKDPERHLEGQVHNEELDGTACTAAAAFRTCSASWTYAKEWVMQQLKGVGVPCAWHLALPALSVWPLCPQAWHFQTD